MQSIASRQIRSGDAEIVYYVLGEGSPVILLHPFPVNHEFWLPVAQELATRYRVILPDLRGHGDSGVGEGPATMEKHAGDIARVMDDADIGRAPRGRARPLQYQGARRFRRSPRWTPAGCKRRARARHRALFREHDSTLAG
jgi:hypothetical protein